MAHILNEAVSVLEAELGPIAAPANLDPAAIRAGIEAHVPSLNLTPPSAAPAGSKRKAT
jgi:hypothetical protein